MTTWTPATMGRKGGKASTPAKRRAARANGRKRKLYCKRPAHRTTATKE
jgi:hypothetical protein